MSDRLAPRPAPNVAAADWLQGRVTLFGDGNDWPTVTVGPGFEAYARLFHPVNDSLNAPRWSDIAAANGWRLHPSAEWEQISQPRAGRTPTPSEVILRGARPAWGNLTPSALRELCDVVVAHTTTPDECWFAVWEGSGWRERGTHSVSVTAHRTGADRRPPDTSVPDAPAEWQLDPHVPSFSLPARRYYLYRGAVHDALKIGYWSNRDHFWPQSPNLFWPTDHAWCVSSEVDYDSTLVGGTLQLVTALAETPPLEVLPIPPNAPAQDLINV